MIKFKPLIHRIPYRDPLQYVRILPQDNLVFLDGCLFEEGHLNRNSYIAVDPFDTMTYSEGDIKFSHSLYNPQSIPLKDIFSILKNRLEIFSLEPHVDLPPFQGGVAGFFSYDLCRDIERLPTHVHDDQRWARLILGFYDLVISFDHWEKKAWIISSGHPEIDEKRRVYRAQSRLNECLDVIPKLQSQTKKENQNQHTIEISSNFNRESYINAIQTCKNYILSGDIFEVNLSQRFQCKLPEDWMPLDLYSRIRKLNPAPFSSYLSFGDTKILSSSPERFLKLSHKYVETRPIKGTIKRSKDPAEDKALAEKLKSSEKDIAENTMIVDLMRNDLSKVCLPHTVKVTQYCGLESYQTVHHLVSVVEGTLAESNQAPDLLRAAFPGGSITGAPKIRAMEIIDELEPTERGPYCGSVGYIGFDGCMDTSILIRSYLIKNQQLTFQAGGAIVLDSNPDVEYEETLLKADILKKALNHDFID